MWALILKMFFLLSICALPSEWTSVPHGKWGNLYDEISHSFSFTCAQYFFHSRTNIFFLPRWKCDSQFYRHHNGFMWKFSAFFFLLSRAMWKTVSFRSYHRFFIPCLLGFCVEFCWIEDFYVKFSHVLRDLKCFLNPKFNKIFIEFSKKVASFQDFTSIFSFLFLRFWTNFDSFQNNLSLKNVLKTSSPIKQPNSMTGMKNCHTQWVQFFYVWFSHTLHSQHLFDSHCPKKRVNWSVW